MEKERTTTATTIAEAIHKLQLALLQGIQNDNLLFAAGSLLSKNDYNDLVIERTIAKLCGYPLCPNPLPADRPKKGQYHISIKEHKVYDLHETYLYCCSNCLINSKAFCGSLKEERRSDLNAAKVDAVLRLFDDVGVGSAGEEMKDEANSKGFVIKENENVVANGGVVNVEEWIGPSNAIEGYVPKSDRRKGIEQGNALLNEGNNAARNGVDFEVATSSREVLIDDNSYQLNNAETMGFFPGDVNFKSMIITNDELTSPKKSEGSSKSGRSRAKKGSKAKKSVPKKDNDSIFGGVDFMSTIITQDEYSVSKLPSNQVISDPNPNRLSQEFSEQLNLGDAEKHSKLSEVSACPLENGSQTSVNSAVIRANKNAVCDQNDASSSRRHVKDESHSDKAGRSSNLKSKSSLKNSGAKKASRSVSWADDKINGLAGGNLCEFSEFKETKEGHSTLKGKEAAVNDDSQRFASAEACAKALIEAAEAVSSGQSDANDAVSKVGIIVLPQPEPTDEEKQSLIVDPLEDVAPEKRPNKPGNLNTEAVDPDNSWIDGVPEGFSLTLSPFAMMWDALFSWLTSSSLAFIYGREESFHVEYMSVNGREYPCKAALPDGLSLEIKQTLAGCLSRALAELTADLKLPTLESTVQRQLNFLLDTMSFMDALPPFRIKQWQVIALLFIDALSVCRIPGLTGHLTSRRVLFAKVLDGAQITTEEYEIMKDLMIPLGRVPQFSMQSGG